MLACTAKIAGKYDNFVMIIKKMGLTNIGLNSYNCILHKTGTVPSQAYSM